MDVNDYIENAKKDIEKRKAFEEKERLANEDNRYRLGELIDIINGVFQSHNVQERINHSHIKFYSGFIGNILGINDKKLSQIILDHYFPKPAIPSYYHYTSFENAVNIIASNKIRLYNLNKRFADDEFITFYEEHGMDGYKKGDVVMGIDCSNKSLMSEIFYMSFTGSGTGSLYNSLWRDFGKDGYGVRLEFEIVPKTEDFREVFYAKNPSPDYKPLLKDLFSQIQSKYSKPFNFTYSSKIGAYYIKGKFKNENEYRFIIKRTADDYEAYYLAPVLIDDDNKIGYIEVPFSNDFADLKLISVQPGYNCDDNDIEELQNLAIEKANSFNVLNKAVDYDS